MTEQAGPANEEAREAADSGWGTTFHRHFGSNVIHRDAYPDDCDQQVTPRPVYVFDPDFLQEHDEAVRAAGVAEGIRQAREAIEAAHPNTYDLNWAWQAIDALGEGDR